QGRARHRRGRSRHPRAGFSLPLPLRRVQLPQRARASAALTSPTGAARLGRGRGPRHATPVDAAVADGRAQPAQDRISSRGRAADRSAARARDPLVARPLRRLDAAVLADRATRRGHRAGPRAPPRPARTRVDSRRARRRRARVTIDARAPVQRPRRRAAGRVPDPLANGARRAAPPRERAIGGPHLPSRRLQLRIRVLARLLEAPRRAAGPLPEADQELSRDVTPADSGGLYRREGSVSFSYRDVA